MELTYLGYFNKLIFEIGNMMNKLITTAVECVFVNYKIKPVTYYKENALFEFLLREVWSDLGDPDEHFYLETDGQEDGCISYVRYQFPDIEHAYDRCDEVGMLLSRAVEKWRVIGKWRE